MDSASVRRRQLLVGRVNRASHEVTRGWVAGGMAADGSEVEVLCACGREECFAPISMAFEDYEDIISREPPRFVVVPGHEVEGLDRVVEERERYSLVELIEPLSEEERRFLERGVG